MGFRLAVAAIVLCIGATARAQDLSKGTIEGRFLTSEGATLTNAVVRVTGPAGVVREGLADFDGKYRLRAIPPGTYRVGFWLGRFEVVHVDDVVVRPGEVTKLHVRGPGTPALPQFDPTTAVLATTISRELRDHGVRPGLDLDSMFGVVPGSQGDDYGIGFSGSQSVENRYIVDDVDVTGVVFPGLGAGLPFELVDDVQITTGGGLIEQGEYTGAHVRVVTPHGGNATRGSVFATFAPGALVAAEDHAPSEGASIEADYARDLDAVVGAEVGGTLVKGKAWYWFGVAPRWTSGTVTRKTRTLVDRDQDGVADVDPTTGFEIFEDVDETHYGQWQRGAVIAANVDLVTSRKQQGGLSVRVSPTFGRFTNAYGIVEDQRFATRAIETDVAARWFSRLDMTSFGAVIGVHRSSYRLRSASGTDDEPQQRLGFGDLGEWSKLGGESTATRAACDDDRADDPYPGFTNCPDNGTGYVIGGPGALRDDGEQRVAAHAIVQRHGDAIGVSELTFGLGFEDERAWRSRLLSGDRTIWDLRLTRPVELRSAGTPGTAPCMNSTGVVVGCDPITAGDDAAEQRVRSFTWSSFLDWRWRPLSRLAFEMGMRRDSQALADAIDFGDVWTARMGMSVDPGGQGRSRVYAQWGQYHEKIPLSIAQRLLGGAIEERDYSRTDQCGGDVEGFGGPDGAACDPDDPTVVGQASSASPPSSDPALVSPALTESIIGYDREIGRHTTFGVVYVQRQLANVVEDVMDGDNFELLVANPGGGLVTEGFDVGRREYNALQFRLTARVHDAVIQASYVMSETNGNYPGLYSPNNGQFEPHLSSQYDFVEAMPNRDGALPQDRTHYVKVDGFYRLPLGFTVGARLRALTGVPIDVLGRHYQYGTGEVFVLPRGAVGRTDDTYGLDLHADYERALGHGLRLRLFVDVLDATNNQAQAAVDNQYSRLSNVDPIVGGSYEDLIWAKERSLTSGAETPTPVKRNPNFRHTTTRYAPLSLQLGARLNF